jgi:hypothetical protein
MTASLWKPGIIVSDAAGEAVSVSEFFVAAAGQSAFTLTSIVYPTGANALRVYVDGELQTVVTDYFETSSVVVTFVVARTEGQRIAFILNATLDFESNSPAVYAADAKAAADAAEYHAGLVTGMATKTGVQQQAYTFSDTYAVTWTGSENRYGASFSIGLTVAALTDGLCLCIRPHATNTVSNVSFQIPTGTGPIGVYFVRKIDPSTGLQTTLSPGDMAANTFHYFCYDSVSTNLILVNPVINVSASIPSEIHQLRQQLLGVI